MRGSQPLLQLANEGVSRWLAGFGRHDLIDGSLRNRVRTGEITGVAHGPGALAGAVEAGFHNGRLYELRHRAAPAGEGVRELFAADARTATALLAPVHEHTEGRDGWVTLHPDPDLTVDTLDTALALWDSVNRPNLLIGVPSTEAGLHASVELLSRGIGVDFGPVLTVERYDAVAQAHFTGLERARHAGRDLSAILAVISVPITPMVTGLRSACPRTPPVPCDTAALAGARLVFRRYEERLTENRWRLLVHDGARAPRIRWTGLGPPPGPAPSPPRSRTHYVEELVVWGAISTLSRHTLEALTHHGHPRGDTVTNTHREAEHLLETLEETGVEHSTVAEAVTAELSTQDRRRWRRLRENIGRVLSD
ncbi:transaldolase family protein [Actinopolyspora mortivallis]|uniref:transaldolase family protein n=1 Tax=Actinopolyspora mortivallis TaxID=33906 RepID=UPI000372B4FB|nr:transaldolase family protein [Actinopolyspora mortivallis]